MARSRTGLAVQRPELHVAPGAHTLPHPPQWLGFEPVSIQDLTPGGTVHSVNAQGTHDPALQLPDEHLFSHVPQFNGSVDVFLQSPLQSAPGHGLHIPLSQYPLEQTNPQVPQLNGSVAVFEQVCPGGLHVPLMHVFGAMQGNPQPPQFCSPSRGTHTPPHLI
jgi:hypothetical protein